MVYKVVIGTAGAAGAGATSAAAATAGGDGGDTLFQQSGGTQTVLVTAKGGGGGGEASGANPAGRAGKGGGGMAPISAIIRPGGDGGTNSSGQAAGGAGTLRSGASYRGEGAYAPWSILGLLDNPIPGLALPIRPGGSGTTGSRQSSVAAPAQLGTAGGSCLGGQPGFPAHGSIEPVGSRGGQGGGQGSTNGGLPGGAGFPGYVLLMW